MIYIDNIFLENFVIFVKKLNSTIKNIILNLPESPGIYQFFDKNNDIIYIGKAKNLKKRVKSYFNLKKIQNKTKILVRQITNIKYIIVNTENDAFLLENILIKKYKPKYNIQLKDDKSYPWIIITNDEFPRVTFTRNIKKDKNDYYGPFTSINTVRLLLEISKKIFKIRTCKLKLTKDNIEKRKFKACLQYHLNNCKAPCIGLHLNNDYLIQIDNFRKILKGDIKEIKELIKEKMYFYANNLDFEKAQNEKEKIDIIEKFEKKSTIINNSFNNLEIYSISSNDRFAYINMIKVLEGKIYYAFSTEVRKKLNESNKKILKSAIYDIRTNYLKGINLSHEIVVPLNIQLESIVTIVPQKGIKKELLKLSEKNLNFFKIEKEKQRGIRIIKKNEIEILERVKKDLKLKQLPTHIECFDNSNNQGDNAVSSCVVFKNGKPSKKDYRKFNVKTVIGANDFETMYEVVYRRYKRLKEEKEKMPQLIIIDGGKGQLKYAVKALIKLNLFDKLEIISIAKRLEEIFNPFDDIPLFLDKKSPTLQLIQQLRDEAHRFGISFHRKKSREKMILSELDNIKGIGTKTKNILLKKFKTINNIKKANEYELISLLGKNRAQLIINYFKLK